MRSTIPLSRCVALLAIALAPRTHAQTTNEGFARPRADTLTPQVPDGAYIKEDLPTQRVVPYAYIREADVMWCRRVWRDIDLQQKINLPLYYPTEPINDRKSLFDVIKQALLTEGAITAYDPGVDGWDDSFDRPMSPEEVLARLVHTDSVTTDDITTGEPITVGRKVETKSEDIRRYRLKEDWIFDKQRSTMDIRIIGIAPLKANRGDDGEIRGYEPLFWLYFPELRYVLVNAEVFNRENDGERRSFDHLFWTRQFSSTIVKVSNVYDRNLAEYKTGVDALLEGDKIKQDLLDLELDLWNY